MSEIDGQTPMSDLEKLRHSFRPQSIAVLFVAESPPHGGTFFYKEDSLLYHKMRESFGNMANFLSEFKARGFFLDDLVLYPINQIDDEKERNEHRRKAVSSLALRMAGYQPQIVVVLMCAIEQMVSDAMREAGLSNVPLHVVPFPRREHQERFKAKMAEIIPKLPVALRSAGTLVLGAEQRWYCRDTLRSARLAVLQDAEALPEIIYALERVGAVVTNRIAKLKSYKSKLRELSDRSPLAGYIPRKHPTLHIPFDKLYELVTDARNEGMHQGVFARHLTRHAIELFLILEDALMSLSNRISDFMVKSPVVAEDWQPISLIRQRMLTDSFSFLPVLFNGEWKVVSDYKLAKWLRAASSDGERKQRLTISLKDAIKKMSLELVDPVIATNEEAISDLLASTDGRPILVIDKDKRLIGIATPYDLL